MTPTQRIVLEALRDPEGDLSPLLNLIRSELFALGVSDAVAEPALSCPRGWHQLTIKGRRFSYDIWLRPAFSAPPELGPLLEISTLTPHTQTKPIFVSAIPRVVARLLWQPFLEAPSADAPTVIERALTEMKGALPHYLHLFSYVALEASQNPALLPFLEFLTTDPHLRHLMAGGEFEPFL